MAGADAGHVPVLLAEALATLVPHDDGRYVDATFGAGGYTRAILDAARCRVWAIDRDPAAIARGEIVAQAYPGRLTLLAGRFGAMDRLLAAAGIDLVDGIALDLGVSSPQIDDPARGFSFRLDGPLDMRMECQGPSAADVVNGAAEAELADIIGRLGEERRARAVARAIVRARGGSPILRTGELARIVRGVVRASGDGIDPATRTFQGLRIFVNDELGEISRALDAAERLLVAGGRLVVVAFHSLEDRLVKRFLAERSGQAPAPSRHAPAVARRAPTFAPLVRRPLTPGEAEVTRNPRARSARLRAAVRTAEPAWSVAT
ncbi:MAG: 16S rRNA (cytosine(1402)-N(4))-methyltransferase RsmH [Alphaproteobacteria bacterium]|nr:16S rRNA (cytosine(1402)-N(4))-methyltransferase RsmH [Alphaproteobacteria bacterium]